MVFFYYFNEKQNNEKFNEYIHKGCKSKIMQHNCTLIDRHRNKKTDTILSSTQWAGEGTKNKKSISFLREIVLLDFITIQ